MKCGENLIFIIDSLQSDKAALSIIFSFIYYHLTPLLDDYIFLLYLMVIVKTRMRQGRAMQEAPLRSDPLLHRDIFTLHRNLLPWNFLWLDQQKREKGPTNKNSSRLLVLFLQFPVWLCESTSAVWCFSKNHDEKISVVELCKVTHKEVKACLWAGVVRSAQRKAGRLGHWSVCLWG